MYQVNAERDNGESLLGQYGFPGNKRMGTRQTRRSMRAERLPSRVFVVCEQLKKVNTRAIIRTKAFVARQSSY